MTLLGELMIIIMTHFQNKQKNRWNYIKCADKPLLMKSLIPSHVTIWHYLHSWALDEQ